MKAENWDDEPASEATHTVTLSAVSRMYVVVIFLSNRYRSIIRLSRSCEDGRSAFKDLAS
jgi:hypothetical protein